MLLALNNNRGSFYSGRMKIQVPKRKCLTTEPSFSQQSHHAKRTAHYQSHTAMLTACDQYTTTGYNSFATVLTNLFNLAENASIVAAGSTDHS